MKFSEVTVGSKYNAWTVVSLKGKRSGTVLCRCICGSESSVERKRLVEGATKRCWGCKQAPRYDFTGSKVGHLTVLRPGDYKSGARGGEPKLHWWCRCDCGKEVQVRSDNLGLHSQKTLPNKSCGCNRSGANNYRWKGHGSISGQYWKQIQKGARERAIDFNLDIQDIWNLFEFQEGKCALTGLPLTMHFTGAHQGDASLDRIDSNQGYSIDNVQWVHKHINQMKLDHTSDYFVQMCKLVAEHHKDQ